jgi:hypothetical protein
VAASRRKPKRSYGLRRPRQVGRVSERGGGSDVLGHGQEESRAEKGHGAVGGVGFVGGSVARGKWKRKRRPCGHVHVEEGEGGEGG